MYIFVPHFFILSAHPLTSPPFLFFVFDFFFPFLSVILDLRSLGNSNHSSQKKKRGLPCRLHTYPCSPGLPSARSPCLERGPWAVVPCTLQLILHPFPLFYLLPLLPQPTCVQTTSSYLFPLFETIFASTLSILPHRDVKETPTLPCSSSRTSWTFLPNSISSI
ncbi:hypothetical protein BGZ63DRAFT_85675 [Mariannaea sp. PMI_226]|nr:hypothetical protein BGZ63DRAFT_85675 [Mariannaea sp. PMI_226]